MMRVLITGSNGLLGQKLVSLYLKQTGIVLIATARAENRLPVKEGYEFYPMDCSNASQVMQVFDQTKPDVVIHTAAMTNVDQCEREKAACWEQNVKAVGHIIAACEKHQAFLLHLSTDFIFDGADGPYDEQALPNPICYYGESKLAAEQLVMGSSLQWAIARTVLVYGIAHDMSRSNIILWVKSSLEGGKTINVVDDQWRTPTLAEDLAVGCYLIAKTKAEGIFNISGSDLLTPYEMAIQTAQYFGLDQNLIHKADASTFTQDAKRPLRTGFILEKATRVLGYTPRSFKEGIAYLANQMAVS
jgi:dTDP-4-dehydrorhamnose reductase